MNTIIDISLRENIFFFFKPFTFLKEILFHRVIFIKSISIRIIYS